MAGYAKALTLTVVFTAIAFSPRASAGEARNVISLDGTWDVAEGAMDGPPARFGHRVAVPGLVDIASPAFADVGDKDEIRFAPTTARWVRLNATKRGTEFGYSLWEFKVFP